MNRGYQQNPKQFLQQQLPNNEINNVIFLGRHKKYLARNFVKVGVELKLMRFLMLERKFDRGNSLQRRLGESE